MGIGVSNTVYPLTQTANCKFAGSSAHHASHGVYSCKLGRGLPPYSNRKLQVRGQARHITPHNRYIRFFCCAGRG